MASALIQKHTKRLYLTHGYERFLCAEVFDQFV
jgi:hypothetical protein